MAECSIKSSLCSQQHCERMEDLVFKAQETKGDIFVRMRAPLYYFVRAELYASVCVHVYVLCLCV
jgi:hypothetical protein